MENQNRAGKVLLILAGLAIALCVGMTIGGVLVYGVMRISDLKTSRVGPEYLDLPLQDLFDEDQAEVVGPEVSSGSVIVEVLPGTPAEQAGLEVGDVVVAVDSQQVGPAGNLARLISQYEPGDRVTLLVRRGDEETRSIRVRLGENPDDPGAPYLGVRFSSAQPQGMQLRELLPFEGQGEWQLDELPMPLPGELSRSGALVISVTERSPADTAGLQQGDLVASFNGESLADAQALTDAVARHQPGDQVTLGVLRPGDEAEVEIEVRLGEHPDQPGKAYLGVTIGDAFYHLRGLGNQGQGMPHNQMPFNWDDLQRRFQLEPPPADDGDL